MATASANGASGRTVSVAATRRFALSIGCDTALLRLASGSRPHFASRLRIQGNAAAVSGKSAQQS
jgi:hypothetical protein